MLSAFGYQRHCEHLDLLKKQFNQLRMQAKLSCEIHSGLHSEDGFRFRELSVEVGIPEIRDESSGWVNLISVYCSKMA